MRVPLYEAVPVELIIEHCWVMDLNTFCKGRPTDAPEDHIYICEYRVDKTARLFSKVSKSKFPVCTKSYAFERFNIRLKMSRTYTPHDLDPAHVKPRGRKAQENEESDRRDVQPVIVHTPVVRVSTYYKYKHTVRYWTHPATEPFTNLLRSVCSGCLCYLHYPVVVL